MNKILNKEPVKRAEKSIKDFDTNLSIVCLAQLPEYLPSQALLLLSFSPFSLVLVVK